MPQDDSAAGLYNLTQKLDLVMRFAMQNVPRVHTVKNVTSAPIEPPDLVYAGIALTDACAHPQNGDTTVTINIFSAFTVDNSPFSVLTDDNFMWIHHIMLADFEKDGMRRQCIVIDIRSIFRCLAPSTTIANLQEVTDHYQRFKASRSTTVVTNALKHNPGNPSRKTFSISPEKRGFGLLQRSSIKNKNAAHWQIDFVVYALKTPRSRQRCCR